MPLAAIFRQWVALGTLATGFGACSSGFAESQSFSVVVPEGNYRVTIEFGDPDVATTTTVKSENRRLMLEEIQTAPGGCVTRSFLVNVHTPKIFAERSVRLKDRERGILRWDDKLNLEFSGPHPAVRKVDVAPADDVVTLYIAGDSTVTDQTDEPWAGWGQMLPRFFKPDRVVISNHSESGETLASFKGERRLEKVLTTLRKGDYLFIQFGHNDMKQTGPDAGAYKNYTRMLKEFVAAARERGRDAGAGDTDESAGARSKWQAGAFARRLPGCNAPCRHRRRSHADRSESQECRDLRIAGTGANAGGLCRSDALE